MKRQLLVLILSLFSLSLQAADIRYYDVEVIIFENLQANAHQSEHWPQQLQREILENSIEIGGPWPGGRPEEYDPALSFIPLPESQWRLTSEAEKIDHSGSRRLLAHLAWVQPGLPQAQALSVHVTLPVMANQNQEVNKSESGITKQSEPENTATAPLLESGTLDALIRVSLARYLRVETDLLFTLDPQSVEQNRMIAAPDLESKAQTTPAPRYFRVQQVRRRIRSTELHYLDHPVLGMLIMFTPHESVAKKK